MKAPAALIALAFVSSVEAGCAVGAASYVLYDDTATSTARTDRPPARLTLAERQTLEEILEKAAGAVRGRRRISLRVTTAASAGSEVRAAGDALEISLAHALWALRENSPAIGKAYLEFEVAHELAHGESAACEMGREVDLSCERRVDALATEILRRMNVSFIFDGLFNLARARFDALLKEVDRTGECFKEKSLSCVETSLGRRAEACLAYGELDARASSRARDDFLAEKADSWEQRSLLRQRYSSYESERTKDLPELLSVCAGELEALQHVNPRQDDLLRRHAALARYVGAMPPVVVPEPNSRALWSDAVVWQDDALWSVGFSAGPAWANTRRPLRGWMDGTMGYALALLEGGAPEVAFGIRFGNGHFAGENDQGSPSLATRRTWELIWRGVWPLGHRVALVSDLGIGVSRTTYSDAEYQTSSIWSLDARLSFFPLRRLEVTLGGGIAYAGLTALDATILAARAGVALHLGDYGKGELRRAEAKGSPQQR